MDQDPGMLLLTVLDAALAGDIKIDRDIIPDISDKIAFFNIVIFSLKSRLENSTMYHKNLLVVFWCSLGYFGINERKI